MKNIYTRTLGEGPDAQTERHFCDPGTEDDARYAALAQDRDSGWKVATGPGAEAEQQGPMNKPRPSDLKGAWVEYAVRERQADRAEAEAMSKEALIAAYGQDVQ